MKSSPIKALEKLQASRKPNKGKESKPVQLSLELWPEAVRAVPNAVLRGSLFTVSKQRATAKRRELLAAVDGVEIRFKGERFNQTDLDLWEMLLHLARLQPLGNQVSFSAYALLKELGRGTGGKDHDELKEGIARLRGGVVEITWLNEGEKGRTFGGGLVADYYRDEASQRYVVVFDEKMLSLYEGGYTYVDWRQRQALGNNNLAKWLQGFYASHAAPYGYKVETIKNLCGSTIGRLPDFRRLLRAALDELVKVGSIKSWSINDDLINVVNMPTKSQIKHLKRKTKG